MHSTVGFNPSLTDYAPAVRCKYCARTVLEGQGEAYRGNHARRDLDTGQSEQTMQCSPFIRGLLDRRTLTNRFVLVPHSIGLDLGYRAFPGRPNSRLCLVRLWGCFVAQAAGPVRVLRSAVLYHVHKHHRSSKVSYVATVVR